MKKDIRNYAEYQINYYRGDPYPLASWVEHKKPIFKMHHMDFLKVLVILGFIVAVMMVSFQ